MGEVGVEALSRTCLACQWNWRVEMEEMALVEVEQEPLITDCAACSGRVGEEAYH